MTKEVILWLRIDFISSPHLHLNYKSGVQIRITYLESVVHADEVLGLLLHVVPERALDLLVDAEDEREVDEGPKVEHARLVAEEELLLAQQVAQDVQVL